jgi:hypothetical protein
MAFDGGAVLGGALTGALLAGGFDLLVTSLELQLDRPKVVSNPATTTVSNARPGVQKGFPAQADPGGDFFEAIKFLLSALTVCGCHDSEGSYARQVFANNRIFSRHQRNARAQFHENLVPVLGQNANCWFDDFFRRDSKTSRATLSDGRDAARASTRR